MPVLVIDTIKPKNNLTFPVVEDVDVVIKASGARLSEVVANMATSEQVAALQTAIAGKASQSDLAALQTTVSGKASQADLTALQEDVEGKADSSDLTELAATVSGKADAADLTALEAEVNTKADTSALNTATSSMQAQIDEIAQSVGTGTADTEIAQARVDIGGITYTTLKSRLDADYEHISAQISGTVKEVSTHYDTSFSSNTSTNIYKSNQVVIPAYSTISVVKYYAKVLPPEGAFNCFYILSRDNKILDKFEFAPAETGWNSITINKQYSQDAYIAVTRGGIGLSYSSSEKTIFYSNGLFESSQTSADVGDTLTFSQNVPDRYYEFGLEISYGAAGLNVRIDNMESDLAEGLADIAAANSEIAKLDTQINTGSSSTVKYYWDAGSSGIGNGIYKANQGAIPPGSTISTIKFKSANNASDAIIFLLTNEGKIIDKFEVAEPEAGWNTVTVDKSYSETVYIAVSGGAILNTYSTNAKTVYYSDGLFEGSTSDRTKSVGDTISFTQNVPARYYGFDVEINIENKSLVEKISDIEYEISNIELPTTEFVLNGSTMPKLSRTDESGYTLLGRWYYMSEDFKTCCNSGGASIMCKVKNATYVSVDISQVINPSHPDYVMDVEPYIAISVDGATFTRAQIGSGAIEVLIPSTTEHLIWIVVDGMCLNSGNANRNSGWSAVNLNSITSDGDMYKVDIKSKQILFVGDSIVEGINTLGTTSTSEANSQINEFTFKTARKLNSVPLIQGYGGSTAASGINHEKYSIVDNSRDSFAVIMNPDIIVVEYGYNDYNAGQTSEQFIAYYNSLLDLLKNHYSGSPIVCLIPFKQSFAAEIRTIASARNYCYCIETADYNITYSDNAHPDAAGAEEIAKRLSSDIEKIMSKEFFI